MKALEIGVIAGTAVAGGLTAIVFMGGDDAPQATKPGARIESAPADTTEIRNSRYGLRFRHPNNWQSGPAPDSRVVEFVSRGDVLMCMVLVQEQNLPADSTGKPHNLEQMLSVVTPAMFGAMPIPGAKISSFEKANLGGQEARAFTVDVPGRGKIEAHATLRGFGAVVLMCVAKADVASSRETRDAFKLARTSFSFD